ncbi:hypothetical protein ACH4E8_05570 [Streptomyces sp. NPDC017979]|uniref:hypothetical protein n=1 Tax=Streptomyces sp. NPDC017979 TaxID=3365024 RepID=UPI0037BBB3A1
MSPGIDHRWSDVFQSPGTDHWTWTIGEREHFWAFSWRPFQANEAGTEIVRHFTASDNNLQQTDHFDISVSSGNIYRFSAIWVSGT